MEVGYILGFDQKVNTQEKETGGCEGVNRKGYKEKTKQT